MGSEVFGRLYPDWQVAQRAAVQETCDTKDTWVADQDGKVVGFVVIDVRDFQGEIYMIAVDPKCQEGGVGTALTSFALDRMKNAGVTVAIVETGGDTGHDPARKL